MSFDLWSALGASAGTGLLVALGGVMVAAVMAGWRVWRNRARPREHGIRLADY